MQSQLDDRFMKRDRRAIAAESYDLVIIGGAVTGACVARDAALHVSGRRVTRAYARGFWRSKSCRRIGAKAA
jgi:hypothetical protein